MGIPGSPNVPSLRKAPQHDMEASLHGASPSATACQGSYQLHTALAHLFQSPPWRATL